MNKSELIEALAVKKNISQKKSQETINILLISITNSLQLGERVEVRGFGSFVVKHYNQYVGRNPQTG